MALRIGFIPAPRRTAIALAEIGIFLNSRAHLGMSSQISVIRLYALPVVAPNWPEPR